MKSLLVQLDEPTFQALDRLAPKRGRADFIRQAIRRAIREIEEERTRKAYLAYLDKSTIAQGKLAWVVRDQLPERDADPDAIQRYGPFVSGVLGQFQSLRDEFLEYQNQLRAVQRDLEAAGAL